MRRRCKDRIENDATPSDSLFVVNCLQSRNKLPHAHNALDDPVNRPTVQQRLVARWTLPGLMPEFSIEVVGDPAAFLHSRKMLNRFNANAKFYEVKSHTFFTRNTSVRANARFQLIGELVQPRFRVAVQINLEGEHHLTNGAYVILHDGQISVPRNFRLD